MHIKVIFLTKKCIRYCSCGHAAGQRLQGEGAACRQGGASSGEALFCHALTLRVNFTFLHRLSTIDVNKTPQCVPSATEVLKHHEREARVRCDRQNTRTVPRCEPIRLLPTLCHVEIGSMLCHIMSVRGVAVLVQGVHLIPACVEWQVHTLRVFASHHDAAAAIERYGAASSVFAHSAR